LIAGGRGGEGQRGCWAGGCGWLGGGWGHASLPQLALLLQANFRNSHLTQTVPAYLRHLCTSRHVLARYQTPRHLTEGVQSANSGVGGSAGFLHMVRSPGGPGSRHNAEGVVCAAVTRCVWRRPFSGGVGESSAMWMEGHRWRTLFCSVGLASEPGAGRANCFLDGHLWPVILLTEDLAQSRLCVQSAPPVWDKCTGKGDHIQPPLYAKSGRPLSGQMRKGRSEGQPT